MLTRNGLGHFHAGRNIRVLEMIDIVGREKNLNRWLRSVDSSGRVMDNAPHDVDLPDTRENRFKAATKIRLIHVRDARLAKCGQDAYWRFAQSHFR
jgi:hypothetical protein